MPSEYPKASWCSYIVDLDKTTGVRHVMCCELTTCEDASLAIASTLGSSSRNSGSSQSFSCAISGQPSSSQPSQKLPGKDNASSLQDVDPSVLSFDLSAKQTTANMQSLDPSILSCKPSKAKIIDQSQVSASGSFSILDYIVSNGNTSSSGDVRPFEGISHKEKKAAPSSISILGDIFSNGQFVTSAKSENSIKSSGYLYSGGQLVPFAQNENVITRNGFQQKARALTVDIAPPEPNKLALSTSQTLGFSPDSAQAGKSTRATSAALSPKVIRDLPKVPTVVGKPTKTFSALDLTEREAVVDNNQDIVSPFLDVETSFRQQEEWYDVHNSEESEDSAPKLYTPLAPLISTSGLVSPDQMVVRMTVLENLAAAKVLAGQVESLPSFEVNTEDLSRSCDALNLLSYDMSAYSDGSQEHLDFAFASQSKQRLKLTSIFEPSATISEATGVEIALDESGELFLVPVYPDVTEAVTSTSVTEGDPSQNAEQSSILNPGIDLKNVNLDVVFGQGATDLDDESDFSESVDLPHSVNVDSVAQASASAFSRLFKLPSAVKLDPLGLTVARLSQNIKVGDANFRIDKGEADQTTSVEWGPVTKVKDIGADSKVGQSAVDSDDETHDDSEFLTIDHHLIGSRLRLRHMIPTGAADRIENKIQACPDQNPLLIQANGYWEYLKEDVAREAPPKRLLDEGPNPTAVLCELLGLEHKPKTIELKEEEPNLDRRWVRAIHHYNILDTPVHHACRTPSAVSFWAVFASDSKAQIEDVACWKAVVSAQAAKLVDPCIFQSEEAIPHDLYEKGNSTKLRNYLTGRTTICYEPWGAWLSEVHRPDEEAPDVTNSWARDVLKNDSWNHWGYQGLQRPHFVPKFDLDVKGGVSYGGPYSCSGVNREKVVRPLGTCDSSTLRCHVNVDSTFSEDTFPTASNDDVENIGEARSLNGVSEAETVVDEYIESSIKVSNGREITVQTADYFGCGNLNGSQYVLSADRMRLQPECSQDLFEPETDAVESAHPRAEAGEDAGTIVEFDDARDAETFPNVVPTGLVLSETRAESLNSENAKKDIPEVTTDASETVAPEQNSADSSDPVGGFVADSEKTIAQAKARRQAAAAKRISDDDFVDAISDEADPGISEDEDDPKAELSEHGTSPAALQNGRYTSPTKMMDSRFEDPHTPPQSPLKEEDRACWGSDGNGGFCTPTSPNPEEATSTADDNESLCKDALKSFALDVSPEAKNKLARILAGTSSSPAIGTSSDQVSVMAPSVQLTTNDEDPGLAGKCTKNAARLAGIIANVTATTMLNQQETSLCGNSFADDDVFDPEGILAKGVFENNSQSHASETRSTGTSKARFENVSEDEERQQSLHNLNRALAIVDEGGSETGSTPMKAKKPFAMAGRRRTSQISRSFNQYRSRRTSSEQSRMSDADWLEWLLEKAAQEQKKKEGISMGWDYELQEYTHVPGPAKIAQSGPAPATGEHTEVNYNSARATNTTAAEARDDCLEYSLNTSATHSRRSSGNFMSGTSAPSTPEGGVLLHENIIAEEGKAELVAPFEVKSAEEEKEAVVEDDTAKPISSEEAGEATDLPESPQRANTRNSRISISAGDIVEAEMSVKMLAGLPFAVGDILEAEDYIEYGEISEIPDDRPNFPRAFYGDVSIAVGHAAFGLGNWIVRKCLGRD